MARMAKILPVTLVALALAFSPARAQAPTEHNWIEEVVQKVLPSVVNISSVKKVSLNRSPLFSDPFSRDFFGDRIPRERIEQALGSGVIVSRDGYIVTSNHVVSGADEVEVRLSDERVFTARIIGNDPKSDVAVIKIEASNLPAIKMGDSSDLRIGSYVLAVGNPYGLEGTVTHGIISALGRTGLGITEYENFIQTDAPINPGNSGGALVNTSGELVGINTAIASPTGGSVGVGFAIPSNMVKQVMQSLLKNGRVVRGFLGAVTQDVTPVLSKIFKLPDVKGAIVTDLQAKGSAERAGLRRGDVVVRYDGQDIFDGGHLRNLIAQAPIGSRHKLDIIRDGRALQADLIIQEAPRDQRRKTDMVEIREGQQSHPLAGLLVDELTPQMARQMALPVNSGLVVTDVEEGSLAEASGMQPGDVILEVNQKAVPTLQIYQRVVEPIRPNELALLLVNRQGTVLYVPIQTE